MALPKDSALAVRVPREPDPGNPPRNGHCFGRLGRSAVKWRHEDPKGGWRATDNTPKISAPWWHGVPGPSSGTEISVLEDGLTSHLGLPSDTAQEGRSPTGKPPWHPLTILPPRLPGSRKHQRTTFASVPAESRPTVLQESFLECLAF